MVDSCAGTIGDRAAQSSEIDSFVERRFAIDTTSSSGQLILHMFGALAEFERNLIRERTQAGLIAARARGRLGGRPKALQREVALVHAVSPQVNR
jgi:DNA invertase Pin-like site-specific DNA recombinase